MDITSLALKVDSTDVQEANKDLDNLAQKGTKVESATSRMEKSFQQLLGVLSGMSADLKESATASLRVATAMETNASATDKATQSTRQLTAAEIEAAEAARRLAEEKRRQETADRAAAATQKNFIDGLRDQAATLNMSRSQLAAYRAEQLGLTSQAAPFVAQLKASETAVKGVGVSAGQTAAAIRMLPAQFTDVATQLAGGQNPFLILLQQGGQTKDMFGGFGPMFKGLAGYITLGKVAALGSVAAIGALALAYYKGSQESTKFNEAIIMSGNFAGTSRAQLAAYAEQIAATSTATKGLAAEALTPLVASGKVAQEALLNVATAATDMQRATGAAIEETVKEFVKLGENPTSAVKKLNEQYNFLTGSVYAQIAALEKEGKTVEAATLAQNTYANALRDRASQVVQNLGLIERAWAGIVNAAKKGWDAMLDVGREDTPQKKIERLEAEIKRRQAPTTWSGMLSGASLKGYGKPTEDLQREVDILKAVEQRTNLIAEAEGRSAQQRKASVDAIGKVNAMLDQNLDKAGKIKKETEDVRQLFAAMRADPSMAGNDILGKEEELIKAIQKRHATSSKAHNDELAGLRARIKVEQELLDVLMVSTTSYSKMTEGDKLAIQYAEKLANATDKKARAHLAEGQALATKLGMLQRQNEGIQSAIKMQGDTLEAAEKAAEAAEKEAAAVENQVQQWGMGKAALLDITLAQLNKQRADLLATNNVIPGYIEAIERQIAATERLRAAQGTKDANTAADKEREKAIKAQAEAAKSLDKYLDPKKADDFGRALEQSFGRAGKALGQLVRSFAEYADAQEEMEKQRKNAATAYPDDLKKQEEMSRQIDAKMAQSRLDTYATMAGAAKSFFKEGTKGYKAMEAAEKAFRAFELGLALANMVKKIAFTQGEATAVVAAETTKAAAVQSGTASQVASDMVKGTSAAAVGVATQAQGDPYSAWVRMAAMAAVMAALGFAVRGGGKASAPMSATRQATQGTGTVFGDATAKSSSLENSLKLLTESAKIENTTQNNMLTALRSIDSSMRGLANMVVRTLGLTGGNAFGIQEGVLSKNTGNPLANALGVGELNNKITKDLFGPLPALIRSWWGKVKQEIGDTGLIIEGAFKDLQSGNGIKQFADVLTTTSSWFGLKKDSNWSTITGEVSPEITKQFGMIFTGIGDALKLSATTLNRDANEVATTLENFVVNIPRASLKGLTGSALQEAIQNLISAASDEVAKAALPGLDDFQQIGEGYFETVVRVANGIEMAEYALERFGMNAVAFTSLLNKQGDVATEIIRQSIMRYETSTLDTKTGGEGKLNWQGTADRSGVIEVVTGVGKIIQAFAGSAEEIADLYAALLEIRDVMRAVGSNMKDLSAEMIRGAGGLEALKSGLDSYLDNYFTEAEKTAAATAKLQDQFRAIGVQMPATTEDFRKLVEGIDTSTAAGQTLYGQVIVLADSFYDVAAATNAVVDATELLRAARQQEIYILELTGKDAEALAMRREDELAGMHESLRARQLYIYQLEDEKRAAEEAAAAAAVANAERQRIQQQQESLTVALWQEEGNLVAIRRHELSQIDPTNRALQERIWAIQDERAAAQAAAAEQQRIQQQQESVLVQLWQEEGNLVALRQHELNQLDPANRAFQERIWALQDEKAAAAAAAQAAAELAAKMKAIADERYGIEGDILALQKDTAAIRARELAALDPSNRALKMQYYALVDQIEAAEKAAAAAKALVDAWRALTDAMLDEARRLRGEIAGASPAALQSQFAITTAKARAGDQEAAKLLPDISSQLGEAIEGSATSRADLVRQQAALATSLEETARIIAERVGYESQAGGSSFTSSGMTEAAVVAAQAAAPAVAQTSSLFAPASSNSGGESVNVVAELKSIRQDMQAQSLAIATNTRETVKVLKRIEEFAISEFDSTSTGGSGGSGSGGGGSGGGGSGSGGSSGDCCDCCDGLELLPALDGEPVCNPLLAVTVTPGATEEDPPTISYQTLFRAAIPLADSFEPEPEPEPEPDPEFASVVFLLNGDEETGIVDATGLHELTVFGATEIITSDATYPDGCIKTGMTAADYIEIQDLGSEFIFNGGVTPVACTIEFDVKFISNPVSNYPCVWGWYTLYTTNGGIAFFNRHNSAPTRFTVAHNQTFPQVDDPFIPNNTWTRVAYERTSTGAVNLYINGVLVDSSTSTGVIRYSGGIKIGKSPDDASQSHAPIHIARLRVTKGVARRAGGYTDPGLGNYYPTS